MAAPTNSGESDMVTEDFRLNLSPLLSPTWSQLCLTPSPPQSFLPSSSSTDMQYQGSNQSMDDPPQNQEHDDIVNPAPYLAGDSALLQQQQQLSKNWSEASDRRPRGGGIMTMNNQGFEESNMGFEESMEMTTCFYFPPSPTYFPLYRPMPRVFFVCGEQENISLALSCQHILEDKSGALHVLNPEERQNILKLVLFDDFESYVNNKSGDLDQIAVAAGVVTKDMDSLVDNILDADNKKKELTLRRIKYGFEQDEDIVDQPVYELVSVVHQLIQNRGGELDVIFGGVVFSINGLELRYGQGSPTTPETLLICQDMFSFRLWLGHGGQWVTKYRYRHNRLNIGSFTTVEDAISTYEVVGRSCGWEDLTAFPRLFENENRSKLPLQLPSPALKEKPGEDFGLVCCNATGNDEIEVVGTSSEGTGECVMENETRLNSGCLGKRKTKEKNPEGERRKKKTNGVRIAISLEDILQTKGMSLKEAANHLEVRLSSPKYACREYGIPRRRPRKLITQSHPTETLALVDQEGISESNSDTLPSDQASVATVEKITSVVVKEILPPPFLPTARQESLDEDFGNFEVEAVGIGSGGTGQSEMEEGQLNSTYLGKETRKEMTPRGERRNKETGGVRIAISLEEILQAKEMPLKDAAKHLKVSRSTLKRACREYGIKRWPPRKEHELINETRPNESAAVVDQEQIPQLNSDAVLPSNQPRKENELISQTRPNESPAVVDQEQTPQLNSDTVLPSNQVSARPNKSPALVDQEQTPQLNSDKVLQPSTQVSATIDTKSVKLKARYEEVTIVFRLSRPFRKVELEQEVKKRLPLETGTYNINYKDEDDDLILISCDEDLEECISSSSPPGSHCHELFLKPK